MCIYIYIKYIYKNKKINKMINIGKYIYGKCILVSIYMYIYVYTYAYVQIYTYIYIYIFGIPVHMSNSVRLKNYRDPIIVGSYARKFLKFGETRLA